MKKRIVSIILCILIMLSFSGCGKNLKGNWYVEDGDEPSGFPEYFYLADNGKAVADDLSCDWWTDDNKLVFDGGWFGTIIFNYKFEGKKIVLYLDDGTREIYIKEK